MTYVFNPRQVILVSMRGMGTVAGKELHKDNVMAVAWHTPLRFEPLTYGIVLGKDKFSVQLIRESGVYCVNFIDIKQKDAVLHAGSYSGAHEDKFVKSGLKKTECLRIDCPRVQQALGFLECEVIQEVDLEDHILFIGKVLHNEGRAGNRIFTIDEDKFGTVKKA